jgi:hypothetical protein
MNQSYEQYDVIIIGSGKSGQAAINTMKEQGIKALLIELEPHTVATMVNQSLIKPQPSSPIYHTTENQDASLTHHIAVHKQVMSTTINQTVTYTLYTSAPDIDPVIVEADQTNKESSTYMSSSYTSPNHNDNDMIVDAEFVEFSPSPSTNDNQDDDLEVVEPEWVENQDDHDAFSAKLNHFSTHKRRYTAQKLSTQKENFSTEEDANHDNSLYNKSDQDVSLRAKLYRRKTFSQVNQTDETESPIEFDSFPYKASEQHTKWSNSSTPIAPNKEAQQEAEEANKQSFLHSLLDQPLHLERESRLRKRFINKQRIENQQKNVLPSPDQEAQSEGFYQTLPLSKQRNIINKQNHTTEIHEDLPTENTKPDLLQADSNLNRKRTRAQKKKRMFGKQDLLFETRMKKPRHKNIQTDAEPESETVYHFDSSPTPPFTPPVKENHFSFETENVEESPSMEEHHVDTTSSTPSQSNQQAGGDALKRDTIEFEEPYGYSSWEDFVTPYSSNNRKRQEMDQVEKRKIALRGLHNLINNLG